MRRRRLILALSTQSEFRAILSVASDFLRLSSDLIAVPDASSRFGPPNIMSNMCSVEDVTLATALDLDMVLWW